MLNYVKNFLYKNKLYWQYRHIIHKDVWLNYYESYSTKRRNFYANFVTNNDCKCIFEFGCASGPNFKNIQTYVPFKTFCFGYDINKEAINFAKRSFSDENTFFTSILNSEKLNKILLDFGFKSFDLSIYDRVLYLLNEEQVSNHFSEYGKFFNSVIIDDFHNSEYVDHDDAYYSKDYEKILSKFGLKMIINEKSEHVTGSDFFKRSARRLVFIKK